MSIHYGFFSATEKTDLADIEKRLKTLETENITLKNLIATNKSDIKTERTRVDTNKQNISTNTSSIASNLSDILLNGKRVSTAKSKADTAQTKADSAYVLAHTANTTAHAADTRSTTNGNKLLKKVRFMQNFHFHFSNPVVGSFNNAYPLINGYPDVYASLLHRTADTTIHIQLHVFDADTKLDGTEKAEYRITFLQNDGNTVHWDSPTQTISSKRLLFTVYEVDVKMTLGSNFNNWDTFRRFKFHYKPVTPTKVSGNESVVHVCVYSS